MGMVLGKKDEQWYLDSDLKRLARKLVVNNEDELGYIDLDKVIFTSLVGGASLKWWGKCAKLVPQMKLISHYMLEQFCAGDEEAIEAFDQDILDIRYVITINNDRIQVDSGGDLDKMIEITLFHELKHIDPDMNKIVDHDTQDFKSILDRYGVHWSSGLIKNDDGVEESS